MRPAVAVAARPRQLTPPDPGSVLAPQRSELLAGGDRDARRPGPGPGGGRPHGRRLVLSICCTATRTVAEAVGRFHCSARGSDRGTSRLRCRRSRWYSTTTVLVGAALDQAGLPRPCPSTSTTATGSSSPRTRTRTVRAPSRETERRTPLLPERSEPGQPRASRPKQYPLPCSTSSSCSTVHPPFTVRSPTAPKPVSLTTTAPARSNLLTEIFSFSSSSHLILISVTRIAIARMISRIQNIKIIRFDTDREIFSVTPTPTSCS